jgi:hypothetical protein
MLNSFSASRVCRDCLSRRSSTSQLPVWGSGQMVPTCPPLDQPVELVEVTVQLQEQEMRSGGAPTRGPAPSALAPRRRDGCAQPVAARKLLPGRESYSCLSHVLPAPRRSGNIGMHPCV